MSIPIVTLERFAALRAEMEAGARRDDVLRREGLEPEAWIEAQKGWLARMGEELGMGRFELTNRYGAAFMGNLPAAAAQDAAEEPAAAPPVTDAVPLAPGDARRGWPTPAEAGPERLTGDGIPSYLRAESTDPAALPPRGSPAGTTSDALPVINIEDTLPFGKSPGKVALGAAASSREATALPCDPAEMTTAAPTVIDDGDALPFVKPAQGPAPIVNRGSPGRPAAGGGSKPPSTFPVGQVTARMPATSRPRSALPFQPSPPAQTGRTGMRPGPATREPYPGRPPAGDAAEHADETLPVASAPVDTPPMLTIEQYASLTIDLLLDPDRTQEILRRYHLTLAQRALLDASWKARFAVNAAARTGFDAACAAYRAWKLQNRG